LATYRLVRYADDFVVLLAGTEAHAADLREEVAAVLAPMGLHLSEAKTRVCHIDEGFDFLGFRIQRRRKRGTDKRVVYTYPAKKALASIVDRVRALTRRSSHPTLAVLLRQLNPVLRGWCTTSATVCPRRPSATSTSTPGTGWSAGSANDTTARSGPSSCAATSRVAAHPGRGDVVPPAAGHGQPLPLPGRQHPLTLGEQNTGISRIAQRHGLVESRMRGDAHVRFGGRAGET
jgi:hypothetical protein